MREGFEREDEEGEQEQETSVGRACRLVRGEMCRQFIKHCRCSLGGLRRLLASAIVHRTRRYTVHRPRCVVQYSQTVRAHCNEHRLYAAHTVRGPTIIATVHRQPIHQPRCARRTPTSEITGRGAARDRGLRTPAERQPRMPGLCGARKSAVTPAKVLGARGTRTDYSNTGHGSPGVFHTGYGVRCDAYAGSVNKLTATAVVAPAAVAADHPPVIN